MFLGVDSLGLGIGDNLCQLVSKFGKLIGRSANQKVPKDMP